MNKPYDNTTTRIEAAVRKVRLSDYKNGAKLKTF